MRYALVTPVIIAWLGLPGAASVLLGKKKPPEITQTHFSAEDASVQRPVVIPADILSALNNEKCVKDTLKDSSAASGQNSAPLSWFSASIVHLSDQNLADFVVEAEGPLAGSNVTTFWVFAATPYGHKLILSAPAHDLEITLRTWQGYREVELSAETAVEFNRVRFRWDGDKYVQAKSESHEIR